jgi:hypothetical protein
MQPIRGGDLTWPIVVLDSATTTTTTTTTTLNQKQPSSTDTSPQAQKKLHY